MNLLMLFVDGFEDTEAIATLDVLVRGGDKVIKASLMNRLNVKTKCGSEYLCDSLIEDVDINSMDCLIIPGGPGSFKLMPSMEIVSTLIHSFAKANKYVCAICAAPHLIGKLGYFENRNYTVHPGFEKEVIGGTYLRDKGVVVDGLFITAKSMYYSIPFGLAIHEALHGRESKEKLELACQGE